MVTKALLVVLLGTLLGLDGRAAVQSMVSHAIVAATLTGAILGDPWTGFQVGVIAGMMWVHVLPVGGAIPPNVTVISVVTAAVGVRMGATPDALAAALLFSVPFGLLAREIDGGLRQLNVTASRSVVGAEPEVRLRTLAASQAFGVLGVVVEVATCLSLALVLGLPLLPPLLGVMPPGVREGLGLMWALLPVAGGAAVVRSLGHRRGWSLVGGVCLVSLAVWIVARG